MCEICAKREEQQNRSNIKKYRRHFWEIHFNIMSLTTNWMGLKTQLHAHTHAYYFSYIRTPTRRQTETYTLSHTHERTQTDKGTGRRTDTHSSHTDGRTDTFSLHKHVHTDRQTDEHTLPLTFSLMQSRSHTQTTCQRHRPIT